MQVMCNLYSTVIILQTTIITLKKLYALSFKVYLTGNDAEVRPFLRVCTSVYHSYFSWTICITEGVLLSFGAFLAFETRKVMYMYPVVAIRKP